MCGIGGELAAHHRFPGLSTHHITKAGRVHTPTNLIRLCQRCHDCAEGLDTPLWLPDGRKVYWPKLRHTHTMWFKQDREPCEYDPVRLRELHMRPLPELSPLTVYQVEWLARNDCREEAEAQLAYACLDLNADVTVDDILAARMQPC